VAFAALVSVACAQTVFVCPAAAQDLATAQAALVRYDLADPRTYDALEALRRVADANGAEAPTARAVRAYAAVDLLVAATVIGDEGAIARLGSTLGAQDRAAMATLLDQQRARTPTGALAVAAREARATLAALQGRAAAHGARTDAILLLTGPDDLASLRARVRDRFDPVVDTSLDIVPEHANEARRIVAAMRGLRAASRAAEAGDPLLLLLRPRIEATLARLSEIIIADASFDDIDAFLTLSSTSITLGYVPRTRIDAEGRPQLSSASPAWPTTTAIALPAVLPPVVRPIEGLAQNPIVTSARPGRVALRIDGVLPSHLVTRLVRSLEGTPLAITHLAVGAQRVAVAFVREDARPADAAHIAIRPGGYALEHRGGRRVEVPRLRVDGHWRFDREALVRQLPATGLRVVLANALAPARELVETALSVATDGRTTIVLP
jgi:hypothetical protein